MRKFKNKHKGFTLIQLTVAMLIFAILTGTAFWGVNTYVNQARCADVEADLTAYQTNIQTAIQYNMDKITQKTFEVNTLNKYLTQGYELTQDDTKTAVTETTKTFMGTSKDLLDPWGHAYIVSVVLGETTENKSPTMTIQIHTMGRDSVDGTEDDKTLTVSYKNSTVETTMD